MCNQFTETNFEWNMEFLYSLHHNMPMLKIWKKHYNFEKYILLNLFCIAKQMNDCLQIPILIDDG